MFNKNKNKQINEATGDAMDSIFAKSKVLFLLFLFLIVSIVVLFYGIFSSEIYSIIIGAIFFGISIICFIIYVVIISKKHGLVDYFKHQQVIDYDLIKRNHDARQKVDEQKIAFIQEKKKNKSTTIHV